MYAIDFLAHDQLDASPLKLFFFLSQPKVQNERKPDARPDTAISNA